MSNPQYDWFQSIPVSQFDPGDLTADFQAIFPEGFADNIKIMHVYNGATVAVDVSFNGEDTHAVWPAGATLIVDFQANHNNHANSAGTLNGKKGQNVWVKTSVNPTWVTVGGFR